MRSRVASIVCVGLCALVVACAPGQESTYYREGIGNDLYWSGLPEATQLEEAYVGHICQQAGGGAAYCSQSSPTSREWEIFVQAGMNDIDRRCDSYLAWLDNKKRSHAPILQQISDTRTATEAIMRIAGASADPITIVGVAFGLAANTFTNVRSRLILEVDQSTIQTVVLSNQRRYREDIRKVRIDNRPAAMHALRSYLRICMPFTIETLINTTPVIFERAGAEGLRREQLISPASVGPATARQEIGRPSRPPLPTLAAYALIVDRYQPSVHVTTFMDAALRKLCVPEAELRTIGPKTTALILVYQQTAYMGTAQAATAVTGRLTLKEISNLNNLDDCRPSETARNFYEAHEMAGNINTKSNVDLLNLKLPEGRKITGTPSIKDLRAKIAEVRKLLSNRQLLRNRELTDQFTLDLMNELVR